jgi:putative transposase
MGELPAVSRPKRHDREFRWKSMKTLNHAKWECKYHVVFIPKCCGKVLYTERRRYFGTVFNALTKQKESRIEEGHTMSDHLHMLISIPPRYSVA